jgi:electron transfer flavoprotein beta subunit
MKRQGALPFSVTGRGEMPVDIIVLLKQVPSTESEIKLAPNGMFINTDDIKWVINPYDEFAVEEALRIRETHGGSVTILSVGPERTVDAMRSALALGADGGILITADSGAGLFTAKLLAAALKTVPFDLIIAGQRAVDDDQYLIGPAVAELLGIPIVAMVTRQEIKDGRIRCHRSLEGGSAVVEAPLPMLFTTQRGLNEPRYASLPGIMKAKKKPLDIKSPEDFGIDMPSGKNETAEILALRLPPERKSGKIIDGESPAEKAEELVRLLHEEVKIF